jgi:omega-6 fatty acid desaturase (delta-12 desaturase)
MGAGRIVHHVPRDLHVFIAPPPPAALGHLKASNLTGAIVAGCVLAVTTGSVWLSAQATTGLWLAGQLLLGAALVEWFVLLHECGHGTLFRARWANTLVGHVAGVLAMIPFPIWKRIHGRHHKWTGWQDLDPTTNGLTPRVRPAWQRAIVNVCWKYWIPLFSVLYRLTNFWNLPRLTRLFPHRAIQVRLIGSAIAVAALYAVFVILVGPAAFVRLTGVAILVGLILEDVLIISQHTHIPMGVSGGHTVMPHAAADQERFTRSLRLPPWASHLTLHFDAHELHHMYPFVPGYRLDDIGYVPANEVGWSGWIARARAIPGEILLFQNRDESGFDV